MKRFIQISMLVCMLGAWCSVYAGLRQINNETFQKMQDHLVKLVDSTNSNGEPKPNLSKLKENAPILSVKATILTAIVELSDVKQYYSFETQEDIDQLVEGIRNGDGHVAWYFLPNSWLFGLEELMQTTTSSSTSERSSSSSSITTLPTSTAQQSHLSSSMAATPTTASIRSATTRLSASDNFIASLYEAFMATKSSWGQRFLIKEERDSCGTLIHEHYGYPNGMNEHIYMSPTDMRLEYQYGQMPPYVVYSHTLSSSSETSSSNSSSSSSSTTLTQGVQQLFSSAMPKVIAALATMTLTHGSKIAKQ